MTKQKHSPLPWRIHKWKDSSYSLDVVRSQGRLDEFDAQLIIHRVNEGPEVDRKLALADELAEAVIKYEECHSEEKPAWGRVVLGVARQYLKMQEEK